jgi:hypothetical protein
VRYVARGRAVPKRILLIAVGVVLFVAISGLLARFLSAEGVERDDVLAVLEAQAAGNVQGMLDAQAGCRKRPSCVATTRANAAKLRRRGAVKILTLTSATAYTLTSASGKTRVAWTVIGKLPVVQCVEVRRSGSFLQGMTVTLVSIGAPIPNEADC